MQSQKNEIQEKFYFSLLKTFVFFRLHVKSEKNRIYESLQKISVQHHELCTISHKLNKAYSVQILLIILQAFMNLIATSFYLVKLSFSDPPTQIPLDKKAFIINMIIFHVVLVVIIVIACSNTSKEVIIKVIYISLNKIFVLGSKNWDPFA